MTATTNTQQEVGIVQPEAETGSVLRALDLHSASSLVVELGDDYLVYRARQRSSLRRGKARQGVVIDNRFRESEFAAQYLQSLLKSASTRCQVKLVLSYSDAMLRSFYVPVVPKAELPQVVEWEAARIFPFVPDSEWFQWQVIDTLDLGNTKKHQIQAAAIPKSRIEPLFSILAAQRGECEVFLSPCLWETELHKSRAPGQTEKASVVVARLFGSRLNLFCFHGAHLEFTREATLEAEVTGSAFDASLNHLQDQSEQRSDPYVYCELDCAGVATLISEELDYYYGRFTQRTIERMLLVAPAAVHQELRDALAKTLGIAVDIYPGNADDQQVFAPLSLATRRKRGLTLTPRVYRRGIVERTATRLGAIIGVMILALVGLLGLLQRQQLGSENAHVRVLTQQLNDLQTSAAYSGLVTLQSQTSTWHGQLIQLQAGQLKLGNFLRQLTTITPWGIYLTDLQLQPAQNAGGIVVAAVSLTGFVSDESAYPELELARFIQALSTAPKLANVSLRNQFVSVSESGKRLQFNLSLEVAP